MKRIINIVLICILVLSVISIYKTNKPYKEAAIAYDTLRKTTGEGDFEDKLKDINKDYKLWIKIDNTNINYPVVQGEDNEKYLNTSFNLEENKSGCIFIDYKNNIDNDKNLILYGHNMKDKSMFENINTFKNKDKFEEGKIKIIKAGKEEVYQVFPVFVVNDDFDKLKTSFTSDKEFKAYVEYMSSMSLYNKEIEVPEKIITLFTCSYEFDNARTIVVAKK